jgi:hypothetical protein
MEDLVKWLQLYSPVVTGGLAVGAGLLFVMKVVIERAVEAQFMRLQKEIELRLERRSRFEERVLTDRYAAAGKAFAQIQKVATDVNRHLHGQHVEGLFREGKELAPLTSVYETLDAERYLLGDELVTNLEHQAAAILSLASAHTPEQVQETAARYARLRGEFNQEMKRTFGIDKIAWS